MNDQSNPWSWWQNALAGTFGPIHDGHPMTGFYRAGNDPVAIWRGDDGTMIALRAGKPVEAEELWTWCCRKPISHELYTAVANGGAWPEQITAEIEAATPSIGHNSATPEDEARDEIDILDRAWSDWLASIGGKITTEEHDQKAGTFQKRYAELAGKFDSVRDGIKRPYLVKGREIDAAWKPLIEKADAGKRSVGQIVTPYRVERQRRIDEAEKARVAEERRIRDEAAKAAQAAVMAGEPPPPPPPAPEPVAPVRKAPTGLRTYKVLVIDDLAAVVGVILKIENPPAEFVDACRTIAQRMISAGITVPGARIVVEQKA